MINVFCSQMHHVNSSLCSLNLIFYSIFVIGMSVLASFYLSIQWKYSNLVETRLVSGRNGRRPQTRANARRMFFLCGKRIRVVNVITICNYKLMTWKRLFQCAPFVRRSCELWKHFYDDERFGCFNFMRLVNKAAKFLVIAKMFSPFTRL